MLVFKYEIITIINIYIHFLVCVVTSRHSDSHNRIVVGEEKLRQPLSPATSYCFSTVPAIDFKPHILVYHLKPLPSPWIPVGYF